MTDNIQYIDRLLHEWLEATPEESSITREIIRAGETLLAENPGIGRSEWMDLLTRQYPAEVIDAYGTDRLKVLRCLSGLWDNLKTMKQ